MNLIPVFGVQVKSKEVTLSSEHKEFLWSNYAIVHENLFWNQQKQGLKTFKDMLDGSNYKLKLSQILF